MANRSRDVPSSTGLAAELPAEVDAPLQNHFNMMYTVIADIGEPAVRVRLIVDTGSSDLWVKASSAAAPFGPRAGGGRVYDWKESSSAEEVPGEPVEIVYGLGRVVGHEIRDRICLERLCVDAQPFVYADEVSDIPDAWLFDGILGLGYPDLAAVGRGSTFVQSLNATFRHFAVGFSAAGDDLSLGGGYLKMGELGDVLQEAQNTLGQGVTLPVYGVQQHALFWLVRASVEVTLGDYGGFQLRGGDQPTAAAVSGPDSAMAILDSGTSFIGVPAPAYRQVAKALLRDNPDARQKCTTTLLSSPGQLMCMCDAELNPLSFVLTGLDGRKMRVTLGSKDLLQVVGFGAFGQNVCRITLIPSPMGMPLWVLGDVFLRHVYAVHDVLGHTVQLFPQSGLGSATILQGLERGGVVPRQELRHAFVGAIAATAIAVAAAGVSATLAGVASKVRERRRARRGFAYVSF